MRETRMTPSHRRWRQFYKRLEGPEGCNFRRIGQRRHSNPDDPKKIRWDCNAGIARPRAKRVLEKMGYSGDFIKRSLDFFTEHGGYCDCEILFNVEASCRPRRPRRRLTTGKNLVKK